jgi:hypothetical protein
VSTPIEIGVSRQVNILGTAEAYRSTGGMVDRSRLEASLDVKFEI